MWAQGWNTRFEGSTEVPVPRSVVPITRTLSISCHPEITLQVSNSSRSTLVRKGVWQIGGAAMVYTSLPVERKSRGV